MGNFDGLNKEQKTVAATIEGLDPVPAEADLMTKAEWINVVKIGNFVPSDGTGCFVISGYFLNPPLQRWFEDNVFDLANIPEEVTHIAWFNK